MTFNQKLILPTLFSIMGVLLWPSYTYADEPDLTAQPSFSDNQASSSMAWGDYDKDGDLDLVVGNTQSNNQLYRNDQGQLVLAWTFAENDPTESVAWGDYDCDGDLDLAVGNSYKAGDITDILQKNAQPNRLYRNDGSHGFSLVWTTSEVEPTTSFIWADYEGDGDLDLAAGNDANPNRLYLNQNGCNSAEPQFESVWTSPDMDDTSQLAWGDVNGDGRPDLAAANGDSPLFNLPGQPNRLYLNTGANMDWFDSIWQPEMAHLSVSLAWGDYDNDGDLDLIIGNDGAPNHIYRNEGITLTTRPVWSSTEVGATRGVAWGDYDNDGDLDLAVANGCSSRGFIQACYSNYIYQNEPVGLSSEAIWQSVQQDDTADVAWGDYDADGDLDLVMAGGGKLTVGNPNRLYRNEVILLQKTPAWSLTLTQIGDLTWGDYDGDGDLDLAVAEANLPNKLYRNERGHFNQTPVWQSAETDNSRGLAWGDYDGDGDLDLAVANSQQQPNQLYQNNGGHLTSAAVWSTPAGNFGSGIAWGDVDGDDDLDLVVGNDGRPNQLYYNDSTADNPVFTLGWQSLERDQTFEIALGDYDGDGDLDLAVANTSSTVQEANRLYRNQGGIFESEPIWSSAEKEPTFDLAWADYDGDGNLDLAVGNGGQVNRLYRNEGLNQQQQPILNPVWASSEANNTLSIAWGDYDGDGDADLLLANHNPLGLMDTLQLYQNEKHTLSSTSQWRLSIPVRLPQVEWVDYDRDGDLDISLSDETHVYLYENQADNRHPLTNHRFYLTVGQPGHTPAAMGFATAEILTDTVTIPYTLYHSTDDLTFDIKPEFSLNGGGRWQTATPAKDDAALVNLPASATGTPHTFRWQATADVIKHDNVLFRITMMANETHSPIQWASKASKSQPFRVAAPWYVKVVDSTDTPLSNTLVYADGQLLGQTDSLGLLNPGPLPQGTKLVALSQQAEQPTLRANHDGWAYRSYRTNLSWTLQSEPLPFEVTQMGQQRLVVDTPLVLFNLLLSLEWDATEDYLNDLQAALRSASDYLFDVTDGQMALGKVAIYDNQQFWQAADIQISARNNVRPYAYIGGLTSENRSDRIHVGRFWDGNSSNQGPWSAQDGYRTLIHEFGHYGLHLYDEYFNYGFNTSGVITGTVETECTGPDNRLTQTDDRNASIMDWQYSSSELSVRNVAGYWTTNCEQTLHWSVTHESPWETLIRKFSDTQTPPRWQLISPVERGHVLTGPIALPLTLLPPLSMTVVNNGTSSQVYQFQLYQAESQTVFTQVAIVTLYTQKGEAISQGFTDAQGRLAVLGATSGDTIRVASLDGGLGGQVVLSEQPEVTLTLTTAGQRQVTAATPYLRLIPAGNGTTPTELAIYLYGIDQAVKPILSVTPPGGTLGFSPKLSYSPRLQAYTGTITLPISQQGTGQIQTIATANNQLIRLEATYRLQQVTAKQGETVYSVDGNLSLYLPPDSLPATETYFLIKPLQIAPAAPPKGWQFVGQPYDITASGALVQLPKSALLTLRSENIAAESNRLVGLYRWDSNQHNWQAVSATLDADEPRLNAVIDQLGMYALLSQAGQPEMTTQYLPLIIK